MRPRWRRSKRNPPPGGSARHAPAHADDPPFMRRAPYLAGRSGCDRAASRQSSPEASGKQVRRFRRRDWTYLPGFNLSFSFLFGAESRRRVCVPVLRLPKVDTIDSEVADTATRVCNEMSPAMAGSPGVV